jgi:hypothetical protein
MNRHRMTATTRGNSRKRSGPRTAAGKAAASRNALRHGFSARHLRLPPPAADIEQFVRALCGNDEDPELLTAARAVAQSELILRAIGVQKLAVVERLHEPTAIAFRKGDNSLELAEARSAETGRAYDQLMTLIPQLLEKYKDQVDALTAQMGHGNVRARLDQDLIGLVPWQLQSLVVDEPVAAPADAAAAKSSDSTPRSAAKERDEFAALEEAIPDLLRLERYERRALTRRRRDIYAFMDAKLMIALRQSRHVHSPTTG